MKNKKNSKKIGGWAIFILILLAAIGDLVGVIPIVKTFYGTIYWIIVAIYFWKKGKGIFNAGEFSAMLVSWITAAIPVVQEIPIELTGGVIIVLAVMKVEEKTGITIPKPGVAGKTGAAAPLNNNELKMRLPTQAPNPSNQGNIRAPQMPENGEPTQEEINSMMKRLKDGQRNDEDEEGEEEGEYK